MAAVEQEQQQQQQNPPRPPATQLEFRQAMRDFKTMFPEMDEDVIEVVLRSNNGAVDSTIDQLLTMSTDNENERLRTELDATENDELPPRYSPSTPPPSYNQAVPYAQSPAHALAAGDSAAGEQNSQPSTGTASAASQDKTTPETVTAPKQPTVQFKLPHEEDRLPDVPESSETPEATAESPVALKTIKNWKPPLLGELPSNFLKISGLSVVKPAATSKKVTVLSSTLLQQRIEENERKRHDSTSVNDPELTQYLEDERIALFLQNEEFFQELKDNKEFLSTLEREVSSPEEENEAETAEEMDSPYAYCEIGPPEETDAAFREKLKNMGKVSRKKFTQLAKLFSRRKRRSFKPILGDGSNPSRDNLLMHEDEYSELSEDEDETEVYKKDTWNSHVGGPGGKSQTIERSKLDS